MVSTSKLLLLFTKNNNSFSFKVGFSFFFSWVETRNFTVILWSDTLIQIYYPGFRNKAKNSCSPYQGYTRARSKKSSARGLQNSLGSMPSLFTNILWLEPTFYEVTCTPWRSLIKVASEFCPFEKITLQNSNCFLMYEIYSVFSLTQQMEFICLSWWTVISDNL